MSSKTQVTIVGNAGSDPELRFTPTGQAVANFSVAVTPRIYDRQAEKWTDGDTTWFRINCWRSLAENVAESIQKGTRVIVQGSLENREWTDQDENTRYSLEITADAVGPDLMFSTARLTKSERETPGDPESDRDTERTTRAAKSSSRPNSSTRRPAASSRR